MGLFDIPADSSTALELEKISEIASEKEGTLSRQSSFISEPDIPSSQETPPPVTTEKPIIQDGGAPSSSDEASIDSSKKEGDADLSFNKEKSLVAENEDSSVVSKQPYPKASLEDSFQSFNTASLGDGSKDGASQDKMKGNPLSEVSQESPFLQKIHCLPHH